MICFHSLPFTVSPCSGGITFFPTITHGYFAGPSAIVTVAMEDVTLHLRAICRALDSHVERDYGVHSHGPGGRASLKPASLPSRAVTASSTRYGEPTNLTARVRHTRLYVRLCQLTHRMPHPSHRWPGWRDLYVKASGGGRLGSQRYQTLTSMTDLAEDPLPRQVFARPPLLVDGDRAQART